MLITDLIAKLTETLDREGNLKVMVPSYVEPNGKKLIPIPMPIEDYKVVTGQGQGFGEDEIIIHEPGPRYVYIQASDDPYYPQE